MKPITVGLLPFYLELYDTALPQCRPGMEQFYEQIADALTKAGLNVLRAPVCRRQEEFAAAVTQFEQGGAAALITLHLAYSPSLESIDAVAATRLPVLVLDTTPTAEFGPRQRPEEIMGNHGIHGVQDFCNLLLRRNVPFQIEAGHWQESDVLARICALARAAQAVTNLRRARVGCLGQPFKGMGDFSVPVDVMKAKIGMEVVYCAPATLAAQIPAADDPAVVAAMNANLREWRADRNLTYDAHCRSARVALAVHRWLAAERLTAFTFNFLEVQRASGLPTMPFLAAAQAMAAGLGYAGEGDTLTAGLVGALAGAYPETTFTEMFCPDWQGNRVFLSHMGEINPRLCGQSACLMPRHLGFIDTEDPALLCGCLQGGDAVLVNLAPTATGFRLLLAAVEMLEVEQDNMPETIRGWFTPPLPIDEFLAAYSRCGGTHHSALVYGAPLDQLVAFGQLLGWEVAVLE